MTADEVVFWALLSAASVFVLVRRIRQKAAKGEVFELAVLLICPLLPLVPAVLPVPRLATLVGALLLVLLVYGKLRLRERRREAAEQAVAAGERHTRPLAK